MNFQEDQLLRASQHAEKLSNDEHYAFSARAVDCPDIKFMSIVSQAIESCNFEKVDCVRCLRYLADREEVRRMDACKLPTETPKF